MGYKNYWQVLNAKDYGIPQNRERVFIVSIRNDIDKKYDFPAPIKLELRLKDILEKEIDEKYYLSDDKIGMIARWNCQEKPFKKVLGNDSVCGTLTTRSGAECGGLKVYSPNLENTSDLQDAILIKEATKKGYAEASDGDSINFEQPNSKTRRDRVGKQQANTLTTSCNQAVVEPFIVASRGRNPENPSDRTAGSPTDQRLESKTDGCTNTLTTVQKDNYVVDPELRIRKLTPLECWRLMGFDDEDFYKAEKVNSNTQLYKQAGNSIVVNVLEAMFDNLKGILYD